MSTCPNKSSLEWQSLVNSVGKDKAYEAYIKNNEDIPSVDQALNSLSSVISPTIENTFEDLFIPGFTPYLQNETVNYLTEQLLIQIRDSDKITFNQAFSNVIIDIEGLEENQVSPDKIDKIVENADRFRLLVKDKLDRIGLLSSTEVTNEEGVEIDGDQVNDSFYWEDNWVFKFDAKANAQQRVKEFLTFIPKTTIDNEGNFSNVFNYLNTVSYMPLDEVFEELSAILAGTPNTWQDMKTRLTEFIEAKPWIYNLLYQIDEYTTDNEGNVIETRDKQQLLNQFVSTFSLEYSSSKTLLWSEDEGQFKTKVTNTDQNSNNKVILNDWKSSFNTKGFIEEDRNGKLVVDHSAVDAVVFTINVLKDEKKLLPNFFNSLGIKLSEATIKELIEGRVGGLTYDQHFTSNRGIFNLIKKRLSGNDSIGLEADELINPVVNNSGLRSLAFVEEKNNNSVYSNSYINGEGNTVYAYTLGKYLTSQFNKLTKDNEFVKELNKLSFNSPIIDEGEPLYKTWLWHLEHNKENFTNLFEISPFDTTKEQNTNNASQLNSMYDVDLEFTKLQLFQKNYKAGGLRVANYLMTIPAKTTSYVFTAPAITPDLSFSGSLGKNVRDAVYSVALSELRRINSINDKTITVNKYKTGSKYFYFFPVLNKETTPEIWNSDGTVKLPTTNIEGGTVESLIRGKVEDSLNKSVQDKINYWKSIEFIKDGKLVYTDNSYKSNLKNTDDLNNVYAATDYIVNNMLFKYNLHQSFIGDPALYFKNSVEGTWDQVSKRLAGQIAPGRKIAIDSTSESFISVKVKDRKGNIALNYSELLNALGEDLSAPYKDITGTDAQEYTTLKEHLLILYKSGNIDTKLRDTILSKYDKGETLSGKELEGIFKPMKPVYFNTGIDTEQDVLKVEYIKSSSIPLLPQFTKGLELDKIRKALEKLEKETGLPVRLAYDSSTKVGGVNSLDIYNEDGTVIDDIDFTNHYTTLPRSEFRLQQEIPYDPFHDEVVKATQVSKLLFDSILGIEGFNYNGTIYKGENLRALWNDLHKTLFEDAKNELNKELLDEKGNLNIKKAQELLYKEAIKRSYSPAEIASLSLLPDNTFEYPFWAGVSTKKYESILTSLYSNNVVKQKMHGSSYVLVSEEAMQGKSSGIMYTKSYDPTTGLKPYRIENGVVKGAQVLIPWKFKSAIKGFIKDGLIDSSKLPEELLEQFGFRIPTQGHSSMTLLEVVGFTPKTMGDIVVASRNLITQMGSDFDIDKLYVYDYFTKEVEGVLTKEISNKNSILDIHKVVVKNPKIFNQIVTPLGNVKDSVSGIDLKKRNKKEVNNYLTPDYDKQKYLESVDGKAMVGIESLANTLNGIIQTTDSSKQLKIINEKTQEEEFIVFGYKTNKGVKKIALNNLSTPFTWKDNTKNSIIAADQSGAVDNENDPILFYINSNNIAAFARSALRQVGFEHDHINYLLAQPILKDYVNQVRAKTSSLSNNIRNVEQYILSDFINQARTEFIKTLPETVEYSDTDLINYPLTVEELKENFNKPTEHITLAILLKFEQAYYIGKSLQQIQSTINIESGGVGRSVVELHVKANKVTDLFKIKNISNIPSLVGNFTQDEGLQSTTYSGHVLKYGLLEADSVLANKEGELFKYNSRSFKKAVKEVETIIGEVLTTKQTLGLWESYKSYIFSKFYSTEERKGIFFGENSLANRINKYKTTKEGSTNPFIVRLNTEFSVYKTKPDLISYAAAKEEYTDEIGIYQGFISLLSSNNPEVKQIGDDLISYFYLNGGIQQAREWGRYIHPNYLKFYKGGSFLEYIKNVEFQNLNTVGAGTNISAFTTQYFQHKPYLLPKLTEKDRSKIKVENSSIVLPIGEDTITNLVRGEEYIPIFSVDGRNIFIQENDNKYKQIGNLGGINFTEYSNSTIGESLTNNNLTAKINIAPPILNEPKNDTKSIPSIDYSKYEGEAQDVLNNIKKGKLVVDLLKESKVTGVVKININLPDAGKININDNLIEVNPTKTENIETTIIHELIHARTAKAFKTIEGLNTIQINAVEKLKALRETITKQVLNNELDSIGWTANEYNEFVSLLNTPQPTTKERQRLLELRPKYYGLTSNEEFIAELFTRKEFVDQLNKVKYDSKNSFIDRILDLLAQFLKAFSANPNTALEAAIHESLVLIKEYKDNTDATKAEDIIHLSLEETITPEYKKLINQFQSRVNTINQNISKAYIDKDFIKVHQLEARREEVQKELKEFENNQVFESVLALGKKDLDQVKSIFAQPLLSHNDLNYTLRVIKTWTDAVDLVLEEGDVEDQNQRFKDIVELQAQANGLYESWIIKARRNLLATLKEETGITGLTKEVLESQDKINAITANMMDISRSGNIILDVMAKWMKTSAYKAELEAIEITKTVDKLVEDLHKNQIFKKDGYFVFAQTDDKGELTGDLLQPLLVTYYQTRKDLIDTASKETNKALKKEAWRKYFTWLKENHTFIDIRKLYSENSDGTYSYKENSDYTKHLKREFGDNYEDVIEDQKTKIDQYNEELQNKVISLGEDNPDAFREVERWKIKNNPILYLNNTLNDNFTSNIVDGEFIKNEGYRFTVKRANKRWEDTRYSKIQNSPELKAFYDYTKTTLTNLYKFLPPNLKEDLNSSTIPSISKSLIEEFNQEGLNAAKGKALNSIIEAISVEELGNQINPIQDPLTKKPEQTLRVRYLNKLDPKEKSYDLGKVVNAFAMEALGYKYKSTVEDSIKLAYSILNQSMETVKTPSGRTMVDRFGEVIGIKDNRNLLDQVEYAIDSFYGNRKAPQEALGKKVYTNKANSKHKKLEEDLKNKKLSEESKRYIATDLKGTTKEGEELVNESLAFKGRNTKFVSVGRIGDVLLKYMQLKGMGWNIFGSTTNVVFGWFSNYIHSNGGVDFTNAQLLKANKLMLNSTSKSLGVNNSIARKVNALMVKYNVLKEINEAAYASTTHNNIVRKGMENLSPYELQRRGEYFVQGMTMIATMLNTPITINGVVTNVWDASNEAGNIEDKDWNFNPEDKTSGKEQIKLKLKLDQINKSIHGNYDPNSPVRIKKGILGRAVIQFRSWIAEGVANRLEGEKFDLLLGRQRKGRWRTYAELGFKDSFVSLIRIAAGKDITIDNSNKALIVENMKKNLAEIYESLALVALFYTLKALDFDEEDEWSKRATNFAINQTLRLQDDIEFYYSPLAVENITQNFIPVFTLVRDAAKFLDAAEKGILEGEWEYKTGSKAHKNRLLWTGAKLFPASSSWASLMNKSQDIESFRN